MSKICSLLSVLVLLLLVSCNKDETPHGAAQYVGHYRVTLREAESFGSANVLSYPVEVDVEELGDEKLQFIPMGTDFLMQQLLSLTATAYGDRIVFDSKPVELASLLNLIGSGMNIGGASGRIDGTGSLVNREDIEFKSVINYSINSGMGSGSASLPILGFAERIQE